MLINQGLVMYSGFIFRQGQKVFQSDCQRGNNLFFCDNGFITEADDHLH